MIKFQQEIDSLIHQNKLKLALKKVKTQQRKQPKEAELIRLEGIIQLHQKQIPLAERNFLKAINLDNSQASAMANLAFVMQIRHEYSQSERWLKKSININPNSVDANHQLGIVANEQNNYELAESQFKKVLEIHPNHIDCLINLAILLKNKGELEAAIKYLHQALAINPMQPQVYWVLANLKSYRFQENEKEMVQLLLTKKLSQKDYGALLFTKAKILEDEENYTESFKVLKQANQIKYKSFNRTPVNWMTVLEQIKSVFTIEYVSKFQEIETRDISPVLIAGMPRSGSTLIEQMLASHNQITGASELNHLSDIIKKHKQVYPLDYQNFEIQNYKKIADDYLHLTRQWSQNTGVFTDKMPPNINYAGVLLLAIPNAKLIHSRRNAMDVCLSAFKQNFESGSEYSYNLVELVQYYKFQEKLAEHWKIIFPNQVLSVNYEEIIESPEQEIKRLLDFLNLEFDAACLKFYQTKRTIRTASAGQVTQKLYTTATNYYKKYGDSLDELSNLLKQPFGTEHIK